MAAPSQTGVVNKALVLLGTASRITTIKDATPVARAFLAIWDATRDEVLADHPWNCAIVRASIPLSADYAPNGEYGQAFELPTDCLRWLPWSNDHDDAFDGEQEGRYLLSDDDAPLRIRYIARLEDVSRWSPHLIAAVAAKLARYTAKAITGQTPMIDRMEENYQQALRDAKRADGLATGKRRRKAEFRSSWLDARQRY